MQTAINTPTKTPAWRVVGTARDNAENVYNVYRSATNPHWYTARLIGEPIESPALDGAFVGLVDCVQGMGLHGFDLTIG